MILRETYHTHTPTDPTQSLQSIRYLPTEASMKSATSNSGLISEDEMKVHREYMKKFKKDASDWSRETMRYKDHYDMIGVARDATHAEVRQPNCCFDGGLCRWRGIDGGILSRFARRTASWRSSTTPIGTRHRKHKYGGTACQVSLPTHDGYAGLHVGYSG